MKTEKLRQINIMILNVRVHVSVDDTSVGSDIGSSQTDAEIPEDLDAKSMGLRDRASSLRDRDSSSSREKESYRREERQTETKTKTEIEIERQRLRDGHKRARIKFYFMIPSSCKR